MINLSQPKYVFHILFSWIKTKQNQIKKNKGSQYSINIDFLDLCYNFFKPEPDPTRQSSINFQHEANHNPLSFYWIKLRLNWKLHRWDKFSKAFWNFNFIDNLKGVRLCTASFSQLSHRFSKWIYKCIGGFLEFSVSSEALALSWAWNAYVLLHWRLNKPIKLDVKHIWSLQTRLSNDSAASCVKEVECCEVMSPQSSKCTQYWSILPRLLLWFPL